MAGRFGFFIMPAGLQKGANSRNPYWRTLDFGKNEEDCKITREFDHDNEKSNSIFKMILL